MRRYALLILAVGMMLCSACSGSGLSEPAGASGEETVEQKGTAEQREAAGQKETEPVSQADVGELPESAGLEPSGAETAEAEDWDKDSDREAAQSRESESVKPLKKQAAASGTSTAPAVSEPVQKESIPAKQSVQSQESVQSTSVPQTPEPEEIPEPASEEPSDVPESTVAPESTAAPEPTNAPEPVAEKSIYDYEFDVPAIRSELIALGQSMGLTHVTEDDGVPCTPDSCSWASPITASQSFQGSNLKRALRDYVTSMPSVVASYGGSQISCFTIYVRDNGGGSYTFYFLY